MNINLKLDMNKRYQEMEGFGVSGAWWAQIVGNWTHIDEASGMPVRERISQLLFDKNVGIGVNTYRYNMGGGSKNSGKGRFSQPARAAESFDISETEYDWSRDAAAVFMMKDAVKRGAHEVVFFSNTPPERFTINGKSQLDKAGYENIKKENYPKFAKYVLDVVEHFLAEGVPIKYISPVNETMWVWTGKQGQEGCHYQPWHIRPVFREFARQKEERPALKNVWLSGPENGNIMFFNRTLIRQVLNDDLVRRNMYGVDNHSYWVGPAVKKRYKKFMDKYFTGVPVRTSEWTHMKGGRDYSMDSALEQAKVMYEDISILDAVSWQHWIAVSEVDFCDGLIYIDEEAKTFDIPKRYYAFGNFSKFVTEGFKRVELTSPDALVETLAFAKGDELILLLINRSYDYCKAAIDFGAAQHEDNARMYTTADICDLEESEVSLSKLKLLPRSVNTIKVKLI